MMERGVASGVGGAAQYCECGCHEGQRLVDWAPILDRSECLIVCLESFEDNVRVLEQVWWVVLGSKSLRQEQTPAARTSIVSEEQ
jgi:hypothetical protein